MKLELKDVSFSYGKRPVLESITMCVEEGEIVSIVGPNGSGKTTLLKCINRILKPKGNILLDGVDLKKLKLNEIAQLMGYVPQSTMYSFPTTVFDVVLLGRKPYLGWSPSSKDLEIVSNVLSLLGLDNLILRNFNELSDGEKQKILIARALAQEPKLLLLDEPTSNLDIKHQLEVLSLIRNIAKKKKISAIMAIHDLNLASQFSDRIFFLRQGKIYDFGTPEAVITKENIKAVYGVNTIISWNSNKPHIIPIFSG